MDNLQTSLDEFYTLIRVYLGVGVTITLVVSILQIVAMWRIFTKAGEKGWKSLIPIYNMFIYYKVSGISPWFLVLAFGLSILSVIENKIVIAITLIGTFIIVIYQNHSLAKSFGKGFGYTLGLLFLNTIFLLILGLGSAQYVGRKEN